MNLQSTKSLGEVLEVSRERIEPIEHPEILFNYVGLENIEGHSGNLLPYQRTPGAEIKSTKNIFRAGEILYGKLRPYLNKVHLANDDGICSTDIYVLRPREGEINPSFVANYLRSPSVLDAVSSAMSGANLPRIGIDALLGIPIRLPPLPEQQRIAKLLDDADELRKLRAQADRRTIALIPSLFDEMFGDGGADCSWITLDATVERFIDYRGKTPEKSGSGVPLVTARIVKRGQILPADEFISEDIYDAWMRRGLPKLGDVLFTMEAPLGEVAIVNNARIALAQRILLMRPRAELLDSRYLMTALKMPAVWKQIEERATGSTVRGIRQAALRTVEIPVPPLSRQEQFADRVMEVRSLEGEQAGSRRRLDDLFQSMLHRAFNGEL
jgi:type I restriction enzyme S subunit